MIEKEVIRRALLMIGRGTNYHSYMTEREDKMPVDPVCGMTVNEDTPYKIKTEDETYYFCSRACAQEFMENAEEYIEAEQEVIGE
jgi:YHS domain-containing protein